MRYSKLLCPTLKEAPKDAELISHQLMVRAGMIQKVSSGLYNYLPLALKALKNIETIIREELDRIDCQELLMPNLTPALLWQESGRWDKYGPELLRVTDRHGVEYCYGPTFEEAVVDLFRQSVQSYKSLPVTLYQIQNKFRDEIRPRFGLMRGREFIMKDAYSFNLDKASLDESYSAMKEAYHRIFERCGLDVVCVAADSGAIGGDESAEFMVTADRGEDAVLKCQNCDYGANTEVLSVTDNCPQCQKNNFKEMRGIEVGHIFKLGNLYSDKMNASVLDQTGKQCVVEMGCYGIGVGRTMAAAIEQNNDEKGIVWPIGIAPFKVIITLTNLKREESVAAAEQLYLELLNMGVDVLYDDRNISAGIKFKDAELLGIPFQVIVGKGFQDNGEYECVCRKDQNKQSFSKDALFDFFAINSTLN